MIQAPITTPSIPRLTSKLSWLLFLCVAVFCSLSPSSSLAAPVSQTAIVLDFPLPSQQKLPAWIPEPPMEWEMYGGRRIELPIASLPPSSRLAVTVLFEDSPGLSLRSSWEPDSSASPTLIATNLSDSIPSCNSKTFILPPALSLSSGMLVFESAGPSRSILRITAEILQSAPLFTQPTRKNDPLFSIGKRFFSSEELQTEPRPIPPDAWSGNLIEAYLQDLPQPESIYQGLGFSLEIRPAPARAILHFEINGPDPAPEIWVNGYPLPQVSVEVPSLRSPSYFQPAPGSDISYAGWRKGWAYIPPHYLSPGENTFLFSSGTNHDFLRETRIEMFFDSPLSLPPSSSHDILSDLENPISSSPSPTPSPAPTPTPTLAPSPSPTPLSAPLNPSDLFRTSLF